MCGIAGYVGLDDRALLEAMCASLEHRGPDDRGFYEAAGVGLTMRRLSVIDLVTGHQPMSNETGDVWIIFNGEIYNYDDLAADLRRRGHTFRTTSDTETIVHAYEEYGLDFVHHLRGMFGLAIWDDRSRRLIVARDRIGEKPIFYHHDGDRLLFGSEAKTVLQYHRRRRVDPQAICDYFAAGYVPGSRTFFAGVSKLPPGHLLVFENNVLDVRRYWRNESCGQANLSFEDACEQLTELLTDTVKICLKSDVEVGAFLSGGIDSSVLTALMRQHEARVQTFSVGYRGEATGFNELQYAQRVADDLGTQHHELILTAESSISLLPKILWHFDEPHGEPTSVLVYLLCEFTKRRVKVAVGGTGGDEIFFGYPRHGGIRMLQRYRLLPRLVRQQVVERIVSRWPESTRGSRFAKRAKRFVRGSDFEPAEAYLSWISLFAADVRAGLIDADVRTAAEDPAGDAFLRDHLLGRNDIDVLDRAAALDVDGYLPEYQLAYMDRMSMAVGLEVRSPLCDYKVVEFATSLPNHYRLRGTRSKHIFKQIARRWLPNMIVNRRKVGFDSPIGQWAKDELREFFLRFLSRDNIVQSGLLDADVVAALIGEHLAGARDYSLQLWSILALEAWYRMYIQDGITDGTHYQLSDLRGAPGKRPAPAQAV